MAEFVGQRLDLLQRTQNDDGGWGYFPGKRSWMEPTAYAMLALNGRADAAVLDRAWKLVESWQLADGSWRPGADVEGPGTWVTALGVHLSCARDQFDSRFQKGVGWLLGTQGREGNWLARFITAIGRARPITICPIMDGRGCGELRRGWNQPHRPLSRCVWLRRTIAGLEARMQRCRGVDSFPQVPRRRMELWQPAGAGHRSAVLSRDYGDGAGWVAVAARGAW